MSDLVEKTLLWGAALSVVMSALILLTLWWRPRSLLHHYPAIIQNAVPAKTPDERRWSLLAALLAIPLLFGFPAVSSVAQGLSPLDAFLHASGMVLILQLVDLIVIDWLIICALTPSFVVVPGTEGSRGYKDYRFHAAGFARGLPLAALAGLFASMVAMIAEYIDG